MCGIAGIRYVDDRPVDARLIRSMANSISHRGPDSEGFWLADGIGLGHKRLAIIDPTGSAQPMQDARAVVCFNGEIFNYVALRRDLARYGYPFRTEGDTEVLLALYRRYGSEGVSRIQGQFTFAIWDLHSHELWIHRDPIGVIPVYYAWDGVQLTFGSEIKALLPALADGCEIDEMSISEYLAYRTVPWPNTLFRGIHKIPPGHTLHLDGRGNLDCKAYWALPNEGDRSSSPDDDTSNSQIDRLDTTIGRAVSSRCIADVPVGALLSGGLDSSLITALMANGSRPGSVETFSAGFDEPGHDERPYARAVSVALGTRHHELVVRPHDFEDLWSRLTWHRDSPLSEPSEIARYKLASTARGHVKVLLCGEGGDELFAGYPKYAYARIAAMADFVPPTLRRRLLTMLEQRLPAGAERLRVMVRAMAAENEAERMLAWFAPFTRSERNRLFAGFERAGHVEIANRSNGDLIARMLYFDCHTWLVDNLLESLDRMTMAASVEARPPFLDRELVELAFRLPSSQKIRGGASKWILREVARRHLPSQIVDRPKVGFRVPLRTWFRGELREMSRDLLLRTESFVASRMSRPFVEKLLDDHESGSRDESIRIWTLLGLEIWSESVVRRSRSERARISER